MILPTKHLRLRHTLLTAGAAVLARLNRPRTVSDLWDTTRAIEGIGSFRTFTLTLDFLFTIGAIRFDADGLLERVPR